MALDDFHASLALVQVFKDDEWTTGTHFSSNIETSGFYQALAVMTTGTVGVGGSVDIHFDESEDGGVGDPWTEVPDSHFDVITPANDESAHLGRMLLNKRKRYLRAHAILTGHDSFLGVVVILQPYDTTQSTAFDFAV